MEPEAVNGYLYTKWDCPECSEVNEEEGHHTGQVECRNCENSFVINEAN